MSEQLSPQKALKDLSTIKNTIDRTTGAEIFTNFIYSTGTFLATTGAIVILGCITQFYIMNVYGLNETTKKAMIIMWITIGCTLGIVALTMFALQAKKHNMSFISYYKKIVNKYFVQIDGPLEIMATFFIILFIKIERYEFIIPSSVLWIAVVFTSLGAVYLERSFTIVGYIFLVCGGIGLFFMTHMQLVYIACVFGVLPVILGLMMHGRYKQLKENHIAEYETDIETCINEEE